MMLGNEFNNGSNDSIDFQVYLNSNGYSYLNGGNVGIGVRNPSFGLDVQSADDDNVSARFRGNIQVNQMGSTNRAYGFVSTNNDRTVFGGNLRLDDNITGTSHDGYSKGHNQRAGAAMEIANINEADATLDS